MLFLEFLDVEQVLRFSCGKIQMMEVVSSLLGDEREDGEIVDDEDFEEISDYSMPSCGKSDYSRNLIRAISLSSISGDSGGRDSNNRKHNYYASRRKRNRHARMHKRRRRISITSSSEDEKLDSRTLKQLKEAVRINVSEEFHHNSLRTRLRGMIDHDSQDEECLRTIALITQSNDKPKTEGTEETNCNEKDDNDEELSELRLEALKSAFLKKVLDRKRRKEINDKENEEHKKIEAEENEEIEEDEDVMRAMLLASMSKKITELPPSSTPIVHKKSSNKPSFVVKPLIINLNSDSDTNSDNNNKTQDNPKISENVTELLRKQREEFEAKQVAKEEALLDKSVVKLLSKAQQKEYHLLKEKLLLARKLKDKKLLNGVHSSKDGAGKRKSLKDLHIQKDGRYQMKGKYKELAPLKKLVDQANLVRKQQDEKTKRLFKELNEAKLKLASDHKMYSNMVQKLLKAKANIDKRTIVKKTEVKAPLVDNSDEAKNVPEEVHQTVDKNSAIDAGNEVSKYVSPLDHGDIKEPTTNPLEFLCPYELFGVCRDKDCNFNHCT